MGLGNLSNLQSLSRRSKGAKEVLLLDTAEVEPKQGQVREKFAGIEELAESIKVNGQEQPIIVYPKDESGKYRIQKGERRWRACKLAGLPVEAIVNKKEQDDLDETAGELIENIQRENLTPMEIAKGIQKFIDRGWQGMDVAKRLGKSRGYVSSHLSLLKLPECVMRLYDEEVTSDPESLNALRQLHTIAPEQAERICTKALEEGISRKACRELLKQAKKGGLPEDPEIPSSARQEPTPGPGTNDDQPNLQGLEESAGGADGGKEPGAGTPGGSGEESPTPSPGQGGSAAGDEAGAGADPSQEDKSTSKREERKGPESKSATPPQPVPTKEPARARIVVSVSTPDGHRSGVLQTDRIDPEAGYCWVRFDNGGEEPLRARVSDVQLLGVEGEE
ncbi:Chromosome-partitioning protein Spo0J (plasmid) [Halomonas sp. THAF12]|uniref:ParB/RepB/Spo0J family partition protein n=1 Tax=Halomonas sp. THAF12 TaxID=2587849 RepID=UPI0012697E54|nr:ParB/RepB/Spo0J family partition protein [Halomonas sp. THAF12]QFT86835.1 Chromosome-partitioning protein Spo0J [Halomonas sp. THAF12]